MNKFLLDLDEFTIISKLGKGGYGEVFLVEHTSTKKQYAAKISINDCIKKQDQANFFIEVDTFANTKNPAVLGFLGFSLSNFKSEPNPTLIVDYMSNGSLDAILEKSRCCMAPIEWNDTKKYINLLGIALGMKYLHSLKIVQRDLKPQNILLDDNYYPHISDFGCSKWLDDLDSQNFMNSETGTLLYMAPEILTGSDYTYKVDIYSYSLIAYEIITSEKIIPKGEKPMHFIHNVPNGKRPDISKICDENQVKLLQKCWASDPHERPTFSEIVDKLKEWNFVSHFGIVEEEEVNEYLSLFPNEKLIEKSKEKKTKPVEKSKEKKTITIHKIIEEETRTSTVNRKSYFSSDFNFKISLVGDTCTKKAEIINRFICGSFGDISRMSICTTIHTKQIELSHSTCELTIRDTAGQEEHRFMTLIDIKDSHGVLILANSGVEGQLESLQRWYYDVKEANEEGLIFIVAMNCCSENAINTKRFHEFADQKECQFYEIDANMSNIDFTFTFITECLYDRECVSLQPIEKDKKACLIY